MHVETWKIVILFVLWTKDIFGHEVNLNEKQSKLSNDELLVKESISLDTEGSILELKGIYYTTGPRSRIFVEYPNEEESHRTGKKIDFDDNSSNENEDHTFQPWSILWYIGSFGGLIAFFLVVSCSEWCCRTHIRARSSQNTISNSPSPNDIPPPAYDLFAPPSYDSLCRPDGEKGEYDVYVVPVHTLHSMTEAQGTANSLDSPPSYSVQTSSEIVLNVSLVQELHDPPKTEPQTSTHT
ncbi:hypothetical protein RN001_012843 [Aquatica leii]|uniref:Uncharacterized protein n=1 Tax=Aquatica leii TaxID=1421715 RepID=A0AAN7S7Y3_9COLE|nr:hypothetical protein RN001_012843 [Aquatica leii]